MAEKTTGGLAKRKSKEKKGGKEMKTASEMRKLTEGNAETEASIMNEIERRAKGGANTACTPKFIPYSLLESLIQNGYKISKIDDVMEVELTKIEW